MSGKFEIMSGPQSYVFESPPAKKKIDKLHSGVPLYRFFGGIKHASET
jgi:hypothetical protein